jgi:hypothetical protein
MRPEALTETLLTRGCQRPRSESGTPAGALAAVGATWGRVAHLVGKGIRVARAIRGRATVAVLAAPGVTIEPCDVTEPVSPATIRGNPCGGFGAVTSATRINAGGYADLYRETCSRSTNAGQAPARITMTVAAMSVQKRGAGAWRVRLEEGDRWRSRTFATKSRRRTAARAHPCAAGQSRPPRR